MNADTTDYQQRVANGKAVEHQIITELRKQGINLIDPTSREDMTDKIDGWMVEQDGSRHSVQIKYREGGDDIIFEIIKDIDRNIPGRDMQSKAEFYLVVNRLGEGRLFEVKDIKALAQKLLNYFESIKDTTTKDSWSNTGWEMKVRRDRAHGNRKLMAFMSPLSFKVVKLWRKLLMF
jgi:hypothetical protein